MRNAVRSNDERGVELRKRARELLRTDVERRETGYASSLLHSLERMEVESAVSKNANAKLVRSLRTLYFAQEVEATQEQ